MRGITKSSLKLNSAKPKKFHTKKKKKKKKRKTVFYPLFIPFGNFYISMLFERSI